MSICEVLVYGIVIIIGLVSIIDTIKDGGDR